MIPHFIAAGFLGLHPLQNGVRNMEVNNSRKRWESTYSDWRNKYAHLSSGNLDAIKDEVSTKILVAGKTGGYIVSSDGPIPPTVSLKTYQFYVEVVRKYGAIPSDCVERLVLEPLSHIYLIHCATCWARRSLVKLYGNANNRDAASRIHRIGRSQ